VKFAGNHGLYYETLVPVLKVLCNKVASFHFGQIKRVDPGKHFPALIRSVHRGFPTPRSFFFSNGTEFPEEPLLFQLIHIPRIVVDLITQPFN